MPLQIEKTKSKRKKNWVEKMTTGKKNQDEKQSLKKLKIDKK